MIKLRDINGDIRSAPSWDTFKSWLKRVGIGYTILAIACVLGMWQLSIYQKNVLINKINDFATLSCLTSGQTGVTKFNDLISDLIESRTKQLNKDISEGNTSAVKDDQAAIARYEKDKFAIVSPEQCKIPLLKK